jgi:hypothetical protein
MRTVPKKIDAKVKERCVRLVLDHLQEYPTQTAAAQAVARREGVGKESVRRWVIQAQIDGGQRHSTCLRAPADTSPTVNPNPNPSPRRRPA